jgi:hypothetical protein
VLLAVLPIKKSEDRMRSRLLNAVLAASLSVAGGVSLVGCYASTNGYIATEDPPPPRDEVVVNRPGEVYIHGNWLRDGGNWRWNGGHYERQRVGQRYVEGHWQRNGNQRVYVSGGWRAG